VFSIIETNYNLQYSIPRMTSLKYDHAWYNESCWFMEEIGTYMRCWESPGDLPLVIEIFVSFRSFRCAPLAKRHKISITRGRSPGHLTE
jgi:hypothetical protein